MHAYGVLILGQILPPSTSEGFMGQGGPDVVYIDKYQFRPPARPPVPAEPDTNLTWRWAPDAPYVLTRAGLY